LRRPQRFYEGEWPLPVVGSRLADRPHPSATPAPLCSTGSLSAAAAGRSSCASTTRISSVADEYADAIEADLEWLGFGRTTSRRQSGADGGLR
jgi:hypothetical protein